MDFVSSTVALEFCARNKLTQVQIVLKFDGEKFDIVLQRPPAQSYPGSRPAEFA